MLSRSFMFAWWFGISVCPLSLAACDRDVCGHLIPCGNTCPCR